MLSLKSGKLSSASFSEGRKAKPRRHVRRVRFSMDTADDSDIIYSANRCNHRLSELSRHSNDCLSELQASVDKIVQALELVKDEHDLCDSDRQAILSRLESGIENAKRKLDTHSTHPTNTQTNNSSVEQMLAPQMLQMMHMLQKMQLQSNEQHK